jgi:hypothetical protein
MKIAHDSKTVKKNLFGKKERKKRLALPGPAVLLLDSRDGLASLALIYTQLSHSSQQENHLQNPQRHRATGDLTARHTPNALFRLSQ